MMRPWVQSYAKSPSPAGSSAMLSVIVHAVLIAAAVDATRRAPDLIGKWIENRVYYLPPPDRSAGASGTRETVRYVELAPEGPGAGSGTPGLDVSKPARVLPDTSRTVGDLGRDVSDSPATKPVESADSVFTVLEVDSSAARYPGSFAPAYPPKLLEKGVQGAVLSRYVVDTTGYADTASLVIVRASHPEFATAVHDALPLMRFVPAKMGDRKVRQLVEQEFTFRIEVSASEAVAAQSGAQRDSLNGRKRRSRRPDA